MPNDPYYRHSVWIDVFGILFVGALLLGGIGYLLYNAGGAASGMSGGFSQQSRSTSPVQGHRSVHRPPPSGGIGARSRAAHPSLSSRAESFSSGAAAPFSREWRAEATPSLTGPSALSGEKSQGTRDANSNLFGAADPPSRSSGQFGSGGTRNREANRSAGSGWRAEARRLGGQARALSSQLGQFARDSERKKQAPSNEQGSGEARTASAYRSASNVPEPPPPEDVPIGDHLHWLLVAGVLWGCWRIWRGG